MVRAGDRPRRKGKISPSASMKIDFENWCSLSNLRRERLR
jgi:hypothetical protein